MCLSRSVNHKITIPVVLLYGAGELIDPESGMGSQKTAGSMVVDFLQRRDMDKCASIRHRSLLIGLQI